MSCVSTNALERAYSSNAEEISATASSTPQTMTAAEPRRYTRICRFCSKQFITDVYQRYLCSDECRKEQELKRLRQNSVNQRRKNIELVHQRQHVAYMKRREYYVAKASERKREYPNDQERILHYKGKTICFPYKIRCGVCNICRAVSNIDTSQTNRHHDENIYFDDDPIRNTLEICVECHGSESMRLRKVMSTRGQ